MSARLLAVLRDRRIVAAAFAAVIGGLGWEFAPAMRDAFWTIWLAIVSHG